MSRTATTFVATDPAGYERFMGRWSQRLAPLFVEFAGVQAGEQVLDVGSGTGSLTLALVVAGVAAAVGIDPVQPVRRVRAHAHGQPRGSLRRGRRDSAPLPRPGRGGVDAQVGVDALGVGPVLRGEGAWIAVFPRHRHQPGVFGFNLFCDSLRDALDPTLRGR